MKGARGTNKGGRLKRRRREQGNHMDGESRSEEKDRKEASELGPKCESREGRREDAGARDRNSPLNRLKGFCHVLRLLYPSPVCRSRLLYPSC